MLDHRIHTFLHLCQTLNYTRTAQALSITQPTVTQHIQHLEARYGVKLFTYRSKRLALTAQGERLRSMASLLYHEAQRIPALLQDEAQRYALRFGATRTIGEYCMPSILAQFCVAHPQVGVTMLVENTTALLKKLDDGAIEFAFLEGPFNKAKYDHRLLDTPAFIGVCSPQNPIAHRSVDFPELFDQRLLLREAGSGSRAVLENILQQTNTSVHSFRSHMEIGNLNAIKQLVAGDVGITFLYEIAVREEIQNGRLCPLHIPSMQTHREFNFVCLQNALHKQSAFAFYAYCIEHQRHRATTCSNQPTK